MTVPRALPTMAALHVPLCDGDLRLEPLAERHREALSAACAADAEIWTIYAVNFGPDGFEERFDTVLDHPGRRVFAVYLGDDLVGMTAFLRPDMSAGTVEIGNTYFVPPTRGTGLNGRVKRLMLDHAFSHGIRRIEFRIDERNPRSQAAAVKLGAAKEGVMRAERVTWTGHVRDTGLFSILAHEWAARRG